MNTESKLNQQVEITSKIDGLELDKNNHHDLWIALLLRGIALLVFGLLSVAWPKVTLLALAHIFSIFVIVVGAIDIISGFRSLNAKSAWFLRVILGVVEVGIGLYLLRADLIITTMIFLQAIGLILILQAGVETGISFRSGHASGVRFLLLLSALMNLIIGIALLRQPLTSGLIFLWLIGFYGIIGGAISIAAALSIRPTKD